MADRAQKLYDAALAAQRRGDLARAIESYRACLKLAPGALPALNNLAQCLKATGRVAEAARALEGGLRRAGEEPTLLGALADCRRLLGDLDAACALIERRHAVRPEAANLRVLVTLHRQAGRPEAALAAAKALDARPEATLRDRSDLVQLAGELCDWPALQRFDEGWLRQALAKQRGYAGSPFRWYARIGDAGLLREVARRAAANAAAETRASPLPAAPRAPAHDGARRLRIGFLSRDFRDHPAMKLVANLLVSGEANGVDVHVYALGPGSDDPRRAEVAARAAAFRDLGGAADAAAAEAIRADRLDALVDLMGYTRDAAPGILARRPCAFQVAWLGQPGTTGAPWIDAIVADDEVIPPGREDGASEQVLRIAPSYYPFDDRSPRPARPEGAERAAARRAEGLPAEGFVFACFNQSFKFDPVRFASWCEALRRRADSVLWLLAPPPAAQAALRRAAEGAGVDPARLVFAGRAAHAAHYARLGLADLALDTWLYGGHTTTIDALWCGAPVITRVGATFASRVAASILRAAGLGELVARSEEGYVALASGLAGDPQRHAALLAQTASLPADAPPFASAGFNRAFFDTIRGALAARGAAAGT